LELQEKSYKQTFELKENAFTHDKISQVDDLTGDYDMSAIVLLAGAVSPTDDAFAKNFDVIDQCNGQNAGTTFFHRALSTLFIYMNCLNNSVRYLRKNFEKIQLRQ
jgi:hypothetical protein